MRADEATASAGDWASYSLSLNRVHGGRDRTVKISHAALGRWAGITLLSAYLQVAPTAQAINLTQLAVLDGHSPNGMEVIQPFEPNGDWLGQGATWIPAGGTGSLGGLPTYTIPGGLNFAAPGTQLRATIKGATGIEIAINWNRGPSNESNFTARIPRVWSRWSSRCRVTLARNRHGGT